MAEQEQIERDPPLERSDNAVGEDEPRRAGACLDELTKLTPPLAFPW